jgi:1,4-alpha-glucan branching enzyme
MHLHERLGAWLTPQGCFFRVWAPHAHKVSVLVQDGPYWEVDDIVIEQALAKDGDYWSTTVPGVRAWQLYRFKIEHSGGGVTERLDPAARDVLSSELTRRDPSSRNASVVPGTDPFPWAPFETPRFENFIIYQCHIGSFAGRDDHFNTQNRHLNDEKRVKSNPKESSAT